MNCKYWRFRRNNQSCCKPLKHQSVLDDNKKHIIQMISCIISFLLMIPLAKLLVMFLPPTPGASTADFIRTLLIISIYGAVYYLCTHLGYKIIQKRERIEQ